MKVVTAAEMARIEKLAYADGAQEQEFMEAAGRGVAAVVDAFVEDYLLPHEVVLLCGKGNNAGDAYVAGITLLRKGYTVTARQLLPVEGGSELCQAMHSRFIEVGGQVMAVDSSEAFTLPSEGVVVDAIFGTGFEGAIRGHIGQVVEAVNASDLPVIAIDIPSGLNGSNGVVDGPAIRATETVFLGLPKVGFFLNDGSNYVGSLQGVDFGLGAQYIAQAHHDLTLITTDQVRRLLPPMVSSRHKYQAGVVVGLAGSPGMPGAAQLASFAALRGGAGLVRLLHPQGMEGELSSTPYEVIRLPYERKNVSAVIDALNAATACFIGPGLGRDEATAQLLKEVFPALEIPAVIDADALTLTAQYHLPLPSQAILTPHVGEMRRLLGIEGRSPITMDWLNACGRYAVDQHVTLILKGGPSFMFSDTGILSVCDRGCPGMATAGTGDVLTGVVAALLAQGLSGIDAAILAVYLHALAGEMAAAQLTDYAMTASDLSESLGAAFETLL